VFFSEHSVLTDAEIVSLGLDLVLKLCRLGLEMLVLFTSLSYQSFVTWSISLIRVNHLCAL